MMRLGLAGLACAAVLSAGQASATPTLDANYAPTAPNSGLVVAPRLTVAQTFTVESTGLMTSASAQLRTFADAPTAGVQLQIRALVNGLPSEQSVGATVLASANVAPAAISSSYTWVNFDFGDFAVTAGEQLALVISSTTDGSGYLINGDFAWPLFSYPAGTYAGGRGYDEGASTNNVTFGDAYFFNNSSDPGNNPAKVDFGFQTFVDADATPAADPTSVPEPASLALLFTGLVAAGAARRRNA